MAESADQPQAEKLPEVLTACGSYVLLTANTPRSRYRDELVYFCLPECVKTYEKDPLNSCLAGRILMER
jgi:hypothetical protein